MTDSSSVSNLVIVSAFVVATVVTSLASAPDFSGKANSSSSISLSEVEIEMLTYMSEEEKLARDVYVLMFDTWDAAIFTVIAGSEQTHMGTMKKKLDKYKITDPALPDYGLFTNGDLQAKYFELTTTGALSYLDGLYVGATIEEIDMVDIQHAIDVTTHLDVVTAYQNLLEGSKNHLRAYVRALSAQGFDYAPQYLSQQLFDAIMGL